MYKLKLVISLPAMVSHINLTFLTKLRLMVNANTQLGKMGAKMTFSALSMKILLALRWHGVKKRTIFSLPLHHVRMIMLQHPEDGVVIEEVLAGVLIEVSIVPTDAIIILMEEADITEVDTEEVAVVVMETAMVATEIAGGMEAVTIVDSDTETGLNPPTVEATGVENKSNQI